MTRFGKRTQRFVAGVWLGTAAAEVVLFELARRINDSWFLLAAGLIVVVPLVAGELTWSWFSRPARKRWKRHDLEDAMAAAAKAEAALGPVPPAS
jgi:4-hydroxybenzoate polyprenyltransferase